MHTLSVVLERVSSDLLGMVPFAGDQQTGHDINAYVDEVAGALRLLQAEADDLHRAMVVAGRREH